MITKRQYRSTRSLGPEVRASAQILTPCVTLGSVTYPLRASVTTCVKWAQSHLPVRAAGRGLESIAVNRGVTEWSWGCGGSRGLCLPICLAFSSSPFMNKFFPANFPNQQYQLLFTQGSGENKEGQCCPLSPAGCLPPLLPFVCSGEGVSSRASDGEGGLGGHPAWVKSQLCRCLHGGLWVSTFTSLSFGHFC